MRTTRGSWLIVALVATLALAACSASTGAGPSTSPSPTATSSPAASASASPSASASAATGSGTVSTPADAIARVIASEPRLTGIAPKDPELIGQASWYVVTPASGVGPFVVHIRVGWGDCEAGCISQHTWTYAVKPDGTVSIVAQAGEPVPDDAWPSARPSLGSGIAGTVWSGPTCPVQSQSPDPACAQRPVAGAILLVDDAGGTQLARIVTASDGTFFVSLPPGDYRVTPQPVTGLMGTPEAQGAVVPTTGQVKLAFSYDTGIR